MPRPAYSSTHEWWIWAKSTITGQKPADETYNQLNSTRGLRAQHADAPNNNAGKDTQEFHAKVAAAKLMGITKAEEKYRVKLDKSLYGAAIMMPQIARSAGWPKNMCVLMIRCYMFLIVNYMAQGALLYFIAKEELVWNSFGGQMYLCDFGRDSGQCPDVPDCMGPGGTALSPPRIYSWDLWAMRTYVRDSLKVLFPDRADDINKFADPGEYGLESYYCRLLCCFLFTVTVMSDLMGSINMVKVFIDTPNKAECWVDYEEPTWADKEHAKAIHGWTELDLVTVRVAGMPLAWKIFNVIVVLLPKMFLWKITAEAGTLFLMETSGIADIIVNSVALSFILQIDELLCNELMSDTTRNMLEKLEEYHIEANASEPDFETMADDELYAQNEEQIKQCWGWREILELFPLQLVLVILFTWFCVERYYAKHCASDDAGARVSQSMRLPLGTDFSLLNAFLPHFFPVPREEDPFWVMPED